jgi:hypothetical protein
MVGITQPLCLFASGTKRRRHHSDEYKEKAKPQRLMALLRLDGKTI